CGDQHLLLFRDRRSSRPRIAAKHHDELDAVFLDQLNRAGARLAWIVFVVIGDELDLVFIVADRNAADAVDPVGPDMQPVEAGLAPGGDSAGKRRQETDLHDLVGAENHFGREYSGQQSRGSGGCQKFAAVNRTKPNFRRHWSLRLERCNHRKESALDSLLARNLAAASRARNDLRPVFDLWTILS